MAAPTAFAGRGEGARLGGLEILEISARDERDGAAPLCLDVSEHLERKIEALAAHRTQFAVPRAPSALAPLWRLLGREYFVAAPLAVSAGRIRSASIDPADVARELLAVAV